ncbi:unnamed protein product [Ceutorhynchus assimilis]|uniref:Pre-mRNA polyadenylation factor Fip1 domain-containing protein n=1 Tax=Ceutorhynchus assimilis TaxID=467358 RepID=A0A9N9QR27_9CUCU|nr:unnamed protein product [Ceutorhynchus assimilis]
MAEDIENDDQWLYGDNSEGVAQPVEAAPAEEAPPETNNEEPTTEEAATDNAEAPPNLDPPPEDFTANEFHDDGPPGVDDVPPESQNGDLEAPQNDTEDGELNQNGEEEDEDNLEDDSEEDDVNVVIGDIKTSASYPQQQQHSIKRGGLQTTIGDKSKQIQQTGKFQVEEFEQIGTINGVPACDYNLDALEEKPWRTPGADITDYFNYGFNEDTWKAYCERQKRVRINESGAGLPLMNPINVPPRMPMMQQTPQNFNNMMGPRPMMPPPMMMNNMEPPKTNTIQVMTADRREYSRKPGFPDLSQPPPMGYPVEPYIPPPEYGFNPEPEPFYGGYEPTQDSQWMEGQGNPNWQPTEIKTLTGSPPRMMAPPRRSPSRSHRSPSRDVDRDREERSRSVRLRDHDREKSRRRDRSRSRSRRHKSRSRSPSHRAHKKKKSSRRHVDSE